MADLSFIVGTWRGEGEGGFPTIEPFRYGEQVTLEDVGEGLYVYRQFAWNPETEETIHSEAGYLRIHDDGTLDMTFAYGFGVAEVLEGRLDGTTLDLRSTSVCVAAQGEPVEETTRRISVEGDRLSYEMWMRTSTQPLTRHLAGTLTRA